MTLSCEYSLPGVLYHWRRGQENLRAGDKYAMRHKKTAIFLTVAALMPQDSGVYSCLCREHVTSASLRVIGEDSSCSKSSVTLLSFFFLTLITHRHTPPH